MSDTSQITRDALLALRCQAGDDPQAYHDLVAEFERPLLYFSARLLGDENAALDVLQQVWWTAFRRLRRLEHPEQLRRWLYTVARAAAIDMIRKRDATYRQEREYAQEVAESVCEPEFDDSTAEAIHEGLGALPLALREVLTLHFLEELPVVDVAAIVGCPVGTVKSRLYHAKRQLRKILDACHES
ncbi:MAG: sigma-70 family RNA polymerase sigma factor [Planctomycetales bacterium]|nr:sigma-70 family RNA polymerase sigma factor [Planctomycetales bacterium]